MKLLIINGPNLNLLGTRETEIYGSQSFERYLKKLRNHYHEISIEYFQSNIEGEMINAMQHAGFLYDGIIINAGGYTHTSVALADAVKAIKIPVVEVPQHTGEVASSIEGVLGSGAMKFTRAWYYWVAVGKVPAMIAHKIFAHPEGEASVRIGGHCGCPSPEKYGLIWFDSASGKKIIFRKEYDEAIRILGDGGKNEEYIKSLNKEYVVDSGQPKERFATCYHIDSQAGLLLFSQYMREYYAQIEEVKK